MVTFVLSSLARLHRDEAGQGLVEYLLILALVAFAATAGMGEESTPLARRAAPAAPPKASCPRNLRRVEREVVSESESVVSVILIYPHNVLHCILNKLPK